MSREILLNESAQHPEWDDFLQGQVCGHHEQSSVWGEVKRRLGWSVSRLLAVRSGRIVAGLQLQHRALPVLGGRVGYVPKGPVIGEGFDEQDTAGFLNGVNRLAAELNLRYLVMDPAPLGDTAWTLLKNDGFEAHPNILPPTGLMKATLVISLGRSEEELLAEMHHKTRYNIRYGLRKGVKTREGSPEELALIFHLMLLTCRRRGVAPCPSSLAEVQPYFEALYPRGWSKLLVAEVQGEPVAGALLFPFGRTCRLWKFGWDGRFHQIFPSNVLWWEAIRRANAAGFDYFDLVQLEPAAAEALRATRKLDKALARHPFAGPTRFKLGYGGRYVRLSGGLIKHFDWESRAMERAMRNSLVKRLLRMRSLQSRPQE